MKRIIISLAVVGAVAAAVVVGTTAFFSDTETSIGNTFTAGTIDIDIDGHNPFVDKFNIGDLKPGETGYMNFRINNVGTNPVDVSKKLYGFVKHDSGEGYACGNPINGNVSSEPECVAETGFGIRKDDVENQIIYDLSVEVYNQSSKIWWQAIYEDTEGKHIGDIYNGSNYVDLGMIPAGGYMLVTQSYHFDPLADNKYQGDGLMFNMEIKGDQLTQENGYASVVLENKTGPTAWDVILGDGISGTLSYKTNGSKFEYIFTGKAPLNGHNYVLAVGYNANTNVDTQIGTGATDNNGNINISGSVSTATSMTNAKAWLVPTENWVGGVIGWAGWPTSASNFLWETGLINYTKN